jgi:CubicO group peptidase (beta-lactamase class C family)
MGAILADLPDRIAHAAARHGIPGGAIAIARGDETDEAATGVLDRRTGEPATPESLFHVGSTTKPWTAALVLQLVDDGLVDLDQPVRRYLPGFAVPDANASAEITVRHLLAHTAGFAGDLFEDTGSGDDTLDRYLEYLHEAATQIHAPGEIFSYCNSGYCVLGALVAKLRGGTWESVTRQRLLAPLGAEHVALSPDELGRFAVSAGHLPAPDGGEPIVHAPGQLPRSNAPAGSMMCAAPRDLVRFGRMLATGGGTVLSADAVAQMRAPHAAVPGATGRGPQRWGLGLQLFDWNGAAMFGHDGDVPGQSAVMWILPDHDLVLALCVNANTVGRMVDELVVPIVAELAGVVAPPRPVPPPRSGPGTGDPDGSRFAGRYATPLYEYDVTADGAGLIVVATPRGLAAAMGRPQTTDRYVPFEGDTYITAEPEDGVHSTLAFVQDGRFLHAGRAAPRRGADV